MSSFAPNRHCGRENKWFLKMMKFDQIRKRARLGGVLAWAVISVLAVAQTGWCEPDEKEASPFAGKSIEDLNGDDVLKLVRYSYTTVNREFKGQLRHEKEKIPFLLTLKPESIFFQFSSPYQMIQLNTAEDKLVLKESFGPDAKLEEVDPKWYRQRIRGTDVTFDDISMRFLYWPNAKIIEQEKILGRDAWLVQVMNPSGLGEYGAVRVWVDKGSGGMLKMEGFEPAMGQMIKRFTVQGGKKMGDIWMIDQMLIETLDPDSNKRNKRISHTYMDILDVAE